MLQTRMSHRFKYLLNNETKQFIRLLYLLLLMNQNEKKNVTETWHLNA